MRMESLGIPCDHVVAVLVHLDATKLPKSLILDRWSKNARSRVHAFMDNGPFCWDSMVTCCNWMLSDLCRELCLLGSAGDAEFSELRDKFQNEIVLLKEQKKCMQADRERTEPHAESTTLEGCIRNPLMVRHSKRQRRGSMSHSSLRGVKRCGVCRRVGHNRVSCALNSQRCRHGHRRYSNALEENIHHVESPQDDCYRPDWTDVEYTSFFWDGDGGSDNFDMEIPVSDPYYSSQP
ncbi:hypothetical protein S245_049094 [Arachis hypogaea]|nr:uncharacterized protein DS421_14g472470 [Arachis hypogaea]